MKGYKLIIKIESKDEIRDRLKNLFGDLSDIINRGQNMSINMEMLQDFLVKTKEKDFILQSHNIVEAKVAAKEIFGSKFKGVSEEI